MAVDSENRRGMCTLQHLFLAPKFGHKKCSVLCTSELDTAL